MIVRAADVRRPAWTTSYPPWRPEFREQFRLAGDDWTAPSHLTMKLNGHRTRMRWEARFHQPDGQRMKLSLAFSKAADGQWYVDEEKLDVRLTWKPEVVK